jgi:hypothetical protein
MPDFNGFPKMARLSREMVCTEKLDGTNAQVFIYDPAENVNAEEGFTSATDASGKIWNIKAGSRNRWITPSSDNYGFASWVWRNAEELVKLGAGRHFGEWWGCGIQRNYGLKEKRFSLFNTARWSGDDRPACCHVVPILYSGPFSTQTVDDVVEYMRCNGSVAAPDFMRPEGVIVYHTAAGIGFKKTIEDDESPKSLVKSS